MNERVEADPTMELIVAALLHEIDWDAFGSHDWYPLNYKTGKLSCLGGPRR